MRRRLLAISLFVLAVAAEVRADEPASDEKQGQADAMIREGVALRIEGREAEALERFRSAYELHPSARALGQMGLAAKSLRLYVEAEQYLDRALSEDSDPWVIKNRDALEQARSVVATQLAHLATDPSGEEPVVRPEPPVRTAPAAAPPPPKERAPQQVLVDEPSPLRPWVWTTLALGSAGVTAGAVLGGLTIATKSERDEVCPTAQCPTNEGVELDGELRAYAAATTTALVVGGTALVASLALWLAEEPWKPAQTAWRVEPVLGPSQGGLGVGGRF